MRKVYSAKNHAIEIDQVDHDALHVLEKLQAAGHTSYLVGGGVRDLLLGRRPKDFDISTSATPEEVKSLFRRNCILIGRRFRLAHIRYGRKILEVATFRSGDQESDALITHDNVWGSPEEDVMRRDFTINGLFYDPSTESVIDYVEGFPDLQKELLCTIGQPHRRFKQDPVRMIRLLKFRARFGFKVAEETNLALLECRSEILKSSQARIIEEFLRMLESGAAEPFFRLMAEKGLLELMLPRLAEFIDSEDGEEVFDYLAEVDEISLEDRPLKRPVLLSALLFPLLEKHIKDRFLDRDRIPHLGDLFQEVRDTLHEIFHPFFTLSRRMKSEMTSLLTSQYRLTPFEPKPNRRFRIPRDPDFGLALKFLELRSQIEPGLQETHEKWARAYTSHKEKYKPPPRQRRRR